MTHDTAIDLLRELRRDWIRDVEWDGDQHGSYTQPAGEAKRAMGARIDAVLRGADEARASRTIDEYMHAMRTVTVPHARVGAALAQLHTSLLAQLQASLRMQAIIDDLAHAAWANPEPGVTLESFLAWMRSELQGFAPSAD